MVIEFTVPGQPQGKGRARIGKVGGFARMFTPAKTVAYEGLIAHAAHQAMRGRPLLEGPVIVSMHIDCQIPSSWSAKSRARALEGSVYPTTKPDADNVIKAIYDGLNGVLWHDDAQVVEGHQLKRYSATPGVRVVVKAAYGVEP